jgi:hypothetical protein
MLIREEQYNIINLLQVPGVQHPDLTDTNQRFPELDSPITEPHRYLHLLLNNRLRRQLARHIGTLYDNIADLQYYSRCKLTVEVTISSVPSQRDSEINRNSQFVCYRPSGRKCRFGTVYSFIQVRIRSDRNNNHLFALV